MRRATLSALVATALVAASLVAPVGNAPAHAADDPYWVLRDVKTDLSDEPVPTSWGGDVSGGPGEVVIEWTDPPEVKLTFTYDAPPQVLVPGAKYFVQARATGEFTGNEDAGVTFTRGNSLIILPGEKWNGTGVYAEAGCHDPPGPGQGFSCGGSGTVNGELPFTAKKGRSWPPMIHGEKWILGVGALNCSECYTQYIYEYVEILPRYPICDEVSDWFSGGKWFSEEDLPKQPGIIVNDEFIYEDIRRAIRNYNTKNPDREAFVNTELPYAGTAGALQWLFVEGGMWSWLSKKFYRDGNEPRLRDAIEAESIKRAMVGTPHRLTPGEVYELALGYTDGNAKQAALLVHNTLRSLARGKDFAVTQVNKDPDFFDRYLLQLRDHDDNEGPWYHLFGTAYYSMVRASDKGELVTAGVLGARAVGLIAGGWVLDALKVVTVLGILHAPLQSTGINNFLEQVVREKYKGNKPDPEKFCYNVWGFTLGDQLWDQLPISDDRVASTPFSNFPRPDPTNPSFTPQPGRFLNFTNSPLAVQWEVEGHTMIFESGDTLDEVAILGDAPMMLIPVPEEDGTWAALWMGQQGQSANVTFEVTQSGVASSFVRIDAETGDAAVWDLPAAEVGDRFTIALDDATVAPDLVGTDGIVIDPTVLSIFVDDSMGLVDPSKGQWHLLHLPPDGEASATSFFFGAPGDFPITGDWDCDGVDTPGMYRQSDGYVYLRNSNTTGVADIKFHFGIRGDIPIAGDWDGDGCDTLGVFRDGHVYLANTLGANDGWFVADDDYWFGVPGDSPFTGDFNRDGMDTVGLYRESAGFVYFTEDHGPGGGVATTDNEFYFGIPGDRVTAGDWTGDGIDTVAVFRPTDDPPRCYLSYENRLKNADEVIELLTHASLIDWIPVEGRWTH